MAIDLVAVLPPSYASSILPTIQPDTPMHRQRHSIVHTRIEHVQQSTPLARCAGFVFASVRATLHVHAGVEDVANIIAQTHVALASV